ncbi:sensor histidine kinase [Cellulomonas soli]
MWQQRTSARSMPLRVELPDSPLVVRTDGARVRQVLDGLAENAVRVCPPDAPLVLSLRAGHGGDPEGTRAVLQVRDGGPGLSEADYAVAFEPGVLGLRYRDDRPVGVGIGLSLVHGLVQRLGGGIRAGAAPEGGACFTVSLPDTD